MTWAIVLQIEPGPECVLEAQALEGLPHGTPVVLEFGHHRPLDVDYRIAELIRDAQRARDLHLELRGSVRAVSAWWRALAGAPSRQADTSRRRHLELVRGGGDAS